MGKMEDLVEQMKTHMDARFKILETQITDLKTKLDQIENDTKAKLQEFENKFDKIEENTSELRNNTSKSWAEVAGGSQKVFKEIAIATRSEFEQTDAREKNLIIYNKTENEDPEHDNKTESLEVIELTKASEMMLEELKEEDVILENLILSAPVSQDLIDCPIELDHELLVPEMSNRYLSHITNGFSTKIGSGLFSDVFKGITERSSIPIAIKRIRSNYEEAMQMNFEVDYLSRLRHGNIIDLYGCSNDSADSPCIIYPFMVNGPLKEILNSQFAKKLNSRKRLDISKGIAEGIRYIQRRMHCEYQNPQNTLVHRDIKTSNILLDEKMIPKIANFGLLRLAASGDDILEEETCVDICIGTPAYMPPEAFRNDISAKWDVWSFGVVLLEILTGLPSIDANREERDIVTHVFSHIENNKPLKDLWDPCWDKDDMIGLADSIYNIASKRCLVTYKYNRASSEEVVEEFKILLEQS